MKKITVSMLITMATIIGFPISLLAEDFVEGSKLDIIFSGLIGSIIGVIATIGLYWHSRYVSTKRAIVDRLSILQHDVYWNCSESDVFETWDASLKEIWVLYNAFMDFAPPVKKGKICRAWKNYKGEDQNTIRELANEGWIVDNKTPPKNKKEFLHKIHSFIKIL